MNFRKTLAHLWADVQACYIWRTSLLWESIITNKTWPAHKPLGWSFFFSLQLYAWLPSHLVWNKFLSKQTSLLNLIKHSKILTRKPSKLPENHDHVWRLITGPTPGGPRPTTDSWPQPSTLWTAPLCTHLYVLSSSCKQCFLLQINIIWLAMLFVFH